MEREMVQTTQTKWTPGPLLTGRCRQGRYMEVRTRRGHILATVYGSGGDADALDPLPAEANAGLYAAAPDLYSALRRLRDLAANRQQATSADLDAADAALKKAGR